MKVKQRSLDEIAADIQAHLSRFENDPAINISDSKRRDRPYFNARALRAGAYINIAYVSYQNSRNLTRAEAEQYLEWLDAGNIGKHYSLPKITTPKTEPKIKYKAQLGWDVGIKQVEIKSESEHFVTLMNGNREKKKVDDYPHFYADTFDEAKAWLLARCSKQVQSAEETLRIRQKTLEAVKGMTEPD